MSSRAEPADVATVVSPPAAQRRRRWLWRALQAAATVAAFAYLLSLVSPSALLSAVSRVPPLHFAGAMALVAVALLLGALRWRLLFLAFGAPHPPEYGRLCHYYFVGYFYNTCVPGAVGGDVVRALASRHAWGSERAATAGLVTVFVERLLGLSGLLGLISLVSLVHPLPLLGSALLPGALGLCGAVLPIAALSLAPRVSPHLPSMVGRVLDRLPVPERLLPLTAAAMISLATQLVPALSGHLIVSAISSKPSLFDSLLIVPLASASAFIPITVSGAGVREAIFVKLYESVGVAADGALAASLVFWCSQVFVAALNGLYGVVRPVADVR